jgi:hypothetical protein
MDTHRVEALQTAVDSLTKDEYRRFRQWFLNRVWETWDREIEEDSDAGRLDGLIREAMDAKALGTIVEL